jgi:hypothetical protein
MISSSHKSSNREGMKSVFHHFCPGLPVSLTLYPALLTAGSTETVLGTEAKDCQVLIRQLAKHKQTALQWIPGHCQIAGNEHAVALAKKGDKITQTRIRKTSYHSTKPHLKHVFQSVYRHELETKISQKPWKQETAKIPDWSRRKDVADFRLRVGHDSLGTHLHRSAIRPEPYCMLCSIHEPMVGILQ